MGQWDSGTWDSGTVGHLDSVTVGLWESTWTGDSETVGHWDRWTCITVGQCDSRGTVGQLDSGTKGQCDSGIEGHGTVGIGKWDSWT